MAAQLSRTAAAPARQNGDLAQFTSAK
jgi:hypothetical protein